MSSTTLRATCCASVAALLMSAVAAQASVEISASPTSNMNCTPGVCSPTAKKAMLNVADLTNMLASGDVKITTGGGAITITVDSPFSWTSASRLTLDAIQNVSFKAPVTVAGNGAVAITTNDGGTGGDLIFFPGGKLDFGAIRPDLTIDGQVYTISRTLDQLAANIARDHSGFHALVTDIDTSFHGGYVTSPIRKTFNGVFQGLGHSISNLSIDDPADGCIGLFKRIGIGGYVANVVVAKVAMVSRLPRYARMGAVAGCNQGTVANSSVNGMLTGVWVGGVVGYNDGLVQNSSADVTVFGKIAGGLVGDSDGTIVRSRAFGSVTGFLFDGKRNPLILYVGGLAGRAADIEESYAAAKVRLRGKRPRNDQHSGVGGLSGRDKGNIRNSYSTGSVEGGSFNFTGGVVGLGVSGTINRSYALSAVTGSTEEGSSIGGIAGTADPKYKFADAYWDIDTTRQLAACGTGNCATATGLTDSQLKNSLPAGFDPAIWGQKKSINNGYPYLLANPPPQ